MNRLFTRIMLALGVALVIVCIAFLVPLCLRLNQVESQIKGCQSMLRDQELLKPLQTELARVTLQQLPEGLEAPVRSPLRSADLPTLPEIFRVPADQAGLTLVQLSPDVETLPRDAYRQLEVTVTVTGTCSGFHRYLLSLCRLPFLAGLREVTVRRTEPDSVQMVVSAMLSVKN